MNQKSLPQLDWIDKQQEKMTALLQEWSNINSGSDNLPGLALMLQAIQKQTATLNCPSLLLNVPPRTAIDSSGNPTQISQGQALHLIKRPESPFRIFLGGHMDTVYDTSHPFQQAIRKDDNTICGPGTADMKSGLIIMLTALEAFEQHPSAKNIGWEVLINADEEVGSTGSESLLVECAKRNALGLIFEPAFPDGSLVDSRKGSANLTLVVHGRAAHAGRDFYSGRSAIAALANFIVKAEKIIHKEKGITINFGQISGGGPVNIVPNLAICRFNMRANDDAEFKQTLHQLQQLANEGEEEGFTMKLSTQSARPPKPFDHQTQSLFETLKNCALAEGFVLKHHSSGGVCDGNILASAGLPVIDTLGAIGGEIHTSNEYVLLDSLVSRARLTARYLITLAEGQVQ